MSVQYGVVLNKLTQPHSYMCQTIGRDTVEEKELAGFIHDKHPTITKEMAQTVLDAFGAITYEELLKGNGVTLTNFIRFNLTIRGKMKLPTDLIRKGNIQINAIPAKEFQDDFRFLADIGPEIPIPLIKLPVITTMRDSNSALPNWFRANHPMIVDGENLGINRNDTDQGIFLTSPAGNVTEASLQLIGNKRLVGIPTLDETAQPAGTNSVAYKVQAKAKYTPDGDLRSSNQYLYARTTNKVDESNPYVYVNGNASTSPATASYTGDAVTVRLLATFRPDSVLRISAGLANGTMGIEVAIFANGIFEIPVPGLPTGITLAVGNRIALSQTVLNYQRYLMEILEIGASTPPVPVGLFMQDYQSSDAGYYSYPGSKQGDTNRFAVLIGENTHVQFWQPAGEALKFYSRVSEINIVNHAVIVTPGTVQEWDDPGTLVGDDFELSVFVKAGDTKIACKFGRAGWWNDFRWDVNAATKSLSLDYVDQIALPAGYEAAQEAYNTALIYVPNNGKLTTILQEDPWPYTRYPATYLYNDLVMVRGSVPLFDATIWFIQAQTYSQVAGAGFGETKIAYALKLETLDFPKTYKLFLVIVDTNGVTPEKVAERDHVLVDDVLPMEIIGDPNADRFVLVTKSRSVNAPLLATLYTYSSGVINPVGSTLELMPGDARRQYGTGVWVSENLIHINAVTPGFGPVSSFTLEASETGLELVDKWTEPFESQNLGMLGTAVAPALNVYTTILDNSEVYISKYSAVPENTAVTDLESGVQHEAAVGYKQWRHFRIPSVAGQNVIDIVVTGNETMQLHARKNWPARSVSYDINTLNPLAPISMAITGGETVWIMVQGPSDEVGGDPAATITATLPTFDELTSSQTVSGSVVLNGWKNYKITSSLSDTQLDVDLTNLSGDVDLYVRKDAAPTLQDYDCRSWQGGTTPESCTLINSGTATWYIRVNGFEAGSFDITATLS